MCLLPLDIIHIFACFFLVTDWSWKSFVLVNVLLMTTTIYVMRWYRRAFTPPIRFRNTSTYGSVSPILRVNLAQVSVVHLGTYISIPSVLYLPHDNDSQKWS